MASFEVPPKRIPGLDGLRGISILLVFWMHLSVVGMAPISLHPASLGRLGVGLFFALSGYLITNILLDSSSLKRFYWRRSLRIFPAFYCYLGVVCLLWALGVYQLAPLSLIAAATYWMNWYPGPREWPLQHTWSLSVEEQFYLLWPLTMRALGARRSCWLLAGTLAAWPLQRWLRTGTWGHPNADSALFAVTYDTIFWGCLAALLIRGGSRSSWVGIPFGILVALYVEPSWCPVVLIPTLRNGSLAWLVAWVAQHSRHAITRALDWLPLVWLGRRSYGLYLWHILFCDPRISHWLRWPVSVCLALFVTTLSYRWLELPLLRWRERSRPFTTV